MDALRRLKIAISIFVAVAVASNAPRVARSAFYYSYLSHTPDYYKVLRSGDHADLEPAAKIIRESCPPDGKVVLIGASRSILHYLVEHSVVEPPVPAYDAKGADAPEALRFVRSTEGVRFVVVEPPELKSDYSQAVLAGLAEWQSAVKVYEGNRWRVFQVPGPGRVESRPQNPSTQDAGRRQP